MPPDHLPESAPRIVQAPLHSTGLVDRVLPLPTIVWVLPGFAAAYLAFFLWPVALNRVPMFQFFHYLPAFNPIGSDLWVQLDLVRPWATTGVLPYGDGNPYPPISLLWYRLLLPIGFSSAYRIVASLTLACYVLSAFVFPLLVGKDRRVSPVLTLLAVTGAASYGFLFELERGQLNVVAITCAFAAIYIFHRHRRWRLLAYALFILSVQIKIYPAIFIVLLVDDWSEWGKIISRFALIGAANVACFFLFGVTVFIRWVTNIQTFAAHPYLWVGNLSITSFVAQLDQTAPRLAPYQTILWYTAFGLFVVCWLTAWFAACRERRVGLNPFLLLACAVGTLILPGVSLDYKLPILIAPIAIVLDAVEPAPRQTTRMIQILLIALLSAAYAATLFSYTNKPPRYANNFVPVMIILVTSTGLMLVSRQEAHSVSALTLGGGD